MGNLRLAGGTVLLLLAAAATREVGAAEIMHTPEAIRACLCLDQAVTALSDELYQETETHEEQRKALAALEARADAARQRADPADMAQREALGRLLDEREAAVRRFAAETTPHFNTVTESYNRAADAFNRTCGGKAYDWSVLPDVQSSLSCEPAK
jgi:septal ring factor EnvC (AmiA/AmiB activator)